MLEQHQIGAGETGRTSAHVTEYPDAGFSRLVSDFGLDAARALAQSQHEALGQVEALGREIPCQFERVPGYLYTEEAGDRDALLEQAKCCEDCGVSVRALDRAPLPFATTAAIEFPNQAQLHPLKYLAGLIRLYAEAGGMISERTHVRAIDETAGVCRVRTDRSVLYSTWVVSGTDAPITCGTLLDTKLRANRSYVLALRVADGAIPNGLFWDTNDPYHYIRTAPTTEGTAVILGGEDHRVGTDGEFDAFSALERYATERFPVEGILAKWSGQIMEPVDGLPYIGPRDENSRVMVATGYSGNGLTFGTLAAPLLLDAIAGRPNRYAGLYAPNRVLAAKQWAKYAAQNLPAAWTLVADMLPLPINSSVDALKPGEGRVIRLDGEKPPRPAI